MGSLTPGPEDTKKEDYGPRYLAGTTHSLKTIRADTLARGAADSRNGRAAMPEVRPKPARVSAGLSEARTPLDAMPILLTLC
jgi:hypothetical protein